MGSARLTVPAYASPAPLGYPIRYSLCKGWIIINLIFRFSVTFRRLASLFLLASSWRLWYALLTRGYVVLAADDLISNF